MSEINRKVVTRTTTVLYMHFDLGFTIVPVKFQAIRARFVGRSLVKKMNDAVQRVIIAMCVCYALGLKSKNVMQRLRFLAFLRERFDPKLLSIYLIIMFRFT